MQLLEIEGTVRIPETSPAHGVWMRQNARTTWHAIEHFHVYIYAAMGGGYDSIVNGQALCKQLIRIDEAQMQTDRPDRIAVDRQPMCTRCMAFIEEAL
jgi:hypothetical protein